MILDAMRFRYWALQREELYQIYPQIGIDEKSSEWKETPNPLSTKHPRPLVISPPTRISKICQKERGKNRSLEPPKSSSEHQTNQHKNGDREVEG